MKRVAKVPATKDVKGERKPEAIAVDKTEAPIDGPTTGEVPLTKEQQRLVVLQSKTSDVVLALIQSLKDKKAAPDLSKFKFVKDGKAEVRVWLVDKTPEAIEELKKLGFEVLLDPKTSSVVIGRIAIEKLEALSELKQVRLVTAMN
jgi:hypothetical protein